MEELTMELPKHVGKNTFIFLQKEIERYQRVLDFIKNNRYKEHMEGEIKDLVTLREGDYWLEADKNSRFSLASYQLDEDVYLYDFAIDFRGRKDYHRGKDCHTRDIILTSADIGPIWENVFRFDEEYKKEAFCRTLDIYNTTMEKEIVKKTFKDYQKPYIIYGEKPADSWFPEKGYQQTVTYHNMYGRKICETVLTNPQIVMLLSEDEFEGGVYGKEKIEPWVKRYMNPEDDPVKLVEMVGHFGCSQEYQRLVKKL